MKVQLNHIRIGKDTAYIVQFMRANKCVQSVVFMDSEWEELSTVRLPLDENIPDDEPFVTEIQFEFPTHPIMD